MSNVKERPKRTIKRPTYLGYEYLMDDKKFDDDIEIIEDISTAPFQKLKVYEQTPLQSYQQPQQLPNLSDEDLEILELPPPVVAAPPKPDLLGGEASVTPSNAPFYYAQPVAVVTSSLNLFDSFANPTPTAGPAPAHVNQMDDDVTPINPYHELVAENAAAASQTFDCHVVSSYDGTGYQCEPTVGTPYHSLTPSALSRDSEASRDDHCPSIASCSPTSSLSSNGFASPEELENGGGYINPPDSSSSSCSPLNDSSATKSSSKMATGRRSGRPAKMAAGPASLKNVSSSTGNARKKRKRDPNEPQKPVSAYALFFRDTQAAIKGQNPTATFGEVSKIVASMWDSLDNTRKEVYKKKTETAKKEYTKKLSEYRAKIAAKNKGVPAWGVGASSPSPDAPDPHDDVDRAAADARHSAEAAYIERYYAEGSDARAGGGRINCETEVPPPSSSGGRGENCVRVGCSGWAVENVEWDDRYCSDECVVAHCKDVFNAWVSARQTSNAMEHSLPVQRTSVV